MTQIIIDIGAAANDGTGDPLRTAFNDVNLNFDQVFNAGPVGSNIQISNNQIISLNTNGNILLAPNGIGVVLSGTHILPNYSNVRDLGSPTNRWNTLYARYVDITAGLVIPNLDVTGNVTAGQDIIANGSLIGSSLEVGNATIGNASIDELSANTTFFSGVGNLHIPGGTNGYFLQTDGTGNLTWSAGGGSGNGEVGGANTQVQFNNAGNFGGDPNFTWSNDTLSVNGLVNTTTLSVTTGGEIGGNLLVGGDTLGAGIIIFNAPTGNGVVLLAPPLSGADVTLTLPNSVGNANQVLTTDGNGITSWQNAASPYGNANVAAYLPTYTGGLPSLTQDVITTGNVVGNNLVTEGNIFIGGTPFVRTLTVGREFSPVTIPLASNNSFNVLTMAGNVAVYTT
jgi:hypothetical protein